MADSGGATQDVCDEIDMNNHVIEIKSWGILLPMANHFPCLKLTKNKLQVGRMAEVELSADVPYFNSISKVHFEIDKEGDKVFLCDKSANGTFVDDVKVGKGNKRILTTDMVISLSSVSNKAFLFRNFDSMESPPPREVAEKYTITKKLGSGAYGEVKLAFSIATNEAFAVKIIGKKNLSNNPKASQTIESEVQIMKKLSHPCIVNLLEVIETDENVYIFLELVQGGELFQRVEKKEFTEHEAKTLFYQMVLAIKYLHENNIVHRDLKPENILMVSRDQNITLIKVTDFGMSKFLDGKTMLRTMCGTPNYLAPEVILHSGLEPYSSACDVWSLGVILFICLVGYPPFTEDREDYSLKEQILGGRVEYPDCFWRRVSPVAQAIVARMLTVDVEQRITFDQILAHEWLQDDQMRHTVTQLMYPTGTAAAVEDNGAQNFSNEPDLKKRKKIE